MTAMRWTSIRVRADALDALKNAVAGVQGRGLELSMGSAASDAFEAMAERLTREHNAGQAFPPGKLGKGRYPGKGCEEG